MARKRQFYRITAAEFEIFAQLAQQVREDHPGPQLSYVSAAVAQIILRHEPKAKAKPAGSITEIVPAGDVYEVAAPVETFQGEG